jgi:CHAD domain-containing protein
VTDPRRFTVDAERDVDELVRGLVARGMVAAGAERHVRRSVYDTFDWRLRRRGTVLEHDVEQVTTRPNARGGDGPWLVWRDLDAAGVLGRIAIDQVPRFAWELPASPTTDRLSEALEMRALIELVAIDDHQIVLERRDDEGKVEARVAIDRAATKDGDLPTVIEVVPVRGYERAAAEVTDLLAAQVVLHPVERDVVDEALALAGHVPCSYSSKLKITFDPDVTARAAFVTVLDTLFATMRANEDGTRRDLDTEFLHDFRVAVRRTRSILTLAHDVIDPDRRDHLRGEFKWLGDVTTPTRDLDVYLLEYGSFAEAVGPGRREDLDALRSFLVERQRVAQAELVVALDSPRYASLIDEYATWLVAEARRAPARSGPSDAARPARDVTAKRIWKAYRRFVRDGRNITPSSEATRLHELRKDAKKLRYALECFGNLFPPDEIAAGVRELKGVQDVLGTFQDCEVQKASLESFGTEMIAERGSSQAPALLAMGMLVEQLDEREAKARAAFDDRFARFDDHSVRKRFHRLFKAPPDHDEAVVAVAGSAHGASGSSGEA